MTDRRAAVLAIYDLDRTITRVPTWSLFLLHAALRLAPWRLLLIPVLVPVAALRGLRLISRDRLKEVMHWLLIGPRRPATRIDAVAERFAERFVATNILPGARRSIATDRANGNRVIIATAAHRFYAGAIARRLGITDVIATEAQRSPAGEILWRIDGCNSYGPAKRNAITRWMADQRIARADVHVRFHSDDISDRSTFEWADEPVATNPHAPLLRLADERGWQVLDWRNAP